MYCHDKKAKLIHRENFLLPQCNMKMFLEKILKILNVSKVSEQSDIPTKILTENCEYFACYIQSNQKLKHGK